MEDGWTDERNGKRVARAKGGDDMVRYLHVGEVRGVGLCFFGILTTVCSHKKKTRERYTAFDGRRW